MQLPEEILNKIMEISYNINKKEIAQNFRKISDKYIGEKKGETLLNQDNEAIAYSIARMPATYAAVNTASTQLLETLSEVDNKKIKTLIDVGAGTGAATLALTEAMSKRNINFDKIVCLEREEAMMNLGKTLLTESENEAVKTATWLKFDINNDEAEFAAKSDIECQSLKKEISVKELLKADVVITSYMLNEFAEEKVLEIVEKLWNMTNDILIIVDPGTPNDHKRIIKIKNYLSAKGGNIIAPCTCCVGCALPETDWCHFTCRVERTRVQKQVKGGDVPFEDEKFTYLVISKSKYNTSEKTIGRIIRHPIIRTNMIEVKLCSNGEIIRKTYTKKDKELYKTLKKAKVGDLIEQNQNLQID